MEKKQCPFCGEQISSTEVVCPYCNEYLQLACPNCGRIVSENERICPECASKLPIKEIEKPYGWLATASIFIILSSAISLATICEDILENKKSINSFEDFLCTIGFFLLGLFFGICAINKKQNIPLVIILQVVSTILLLLMYIVELGA